jgi:hypothetical protein
MSIAEKFFPLQPKGPTGGDLVKLTYESNEIDENESLVINSIGEALPRLAKLSEAEFKELKTEMNYLKESPILKEWLSAVKDGRMQKLREIVAKNPEDIFVILLTSLFLGSLGLVGIASGSALLYTGGIIGLTTGVGSLVNYEYSDLFRNRARNLLKSGDSKVSERFKELSDIVANTIR